MGPFLQNFTCCTWNAQGLLCVDACRGNLKLKMLLELVTSYDIVLIQEAHCGKFKETFPEKRLEQTHACFWSSSIDTATSGGVCVIITKKLLSMFSDTPLWEELVPGRIAALRLRGTSGGLDIFTVHLEPALSSSGVFAQLSLLRSAIKPYAETHSLLAGDWNFDHDEEDRFDVEAGVFCGRRGDMAKWWDTNLGNFMEWYQGDFTRSGITRTLKKSLSRIDRIYSNLDPADALDLKIAATVVRALATNTERLSDHLPVQGRMSMTRQRTGYRPIPAWIAKHACWHDKVHARYMEWAGLQTDTDIWAQIRSVKTIFRKAAKDVINVTKERGAKTTDEKFYWALRALRGIRNYSSSMLNEAVKAFPELNDLIGYSETWPPCPERMNKLKSEINRLAHVGFEEKAKEIEKARDLPEYERTRRRGGLARWAAQWSPNRRKTGGLAGVRKEDGSITTDPETACQELGAFWASTFTEKPIDQRGAKEFLRKWAVQLPTIQWELGEDEFAKVLSKTGDTAPGPDGIPYAAWRGAPKEVTKLLFQAYTSWIQGAEVPDDFNFAFLVLIPKGDHTEDHQLVARAPGDTRPLSLSNSDSKVLANALRATIEEAINNWAIQVQRGFIKGRKMLQNVMEVETRAMELSTSMRNRAALIFLDFGAAFPSLSHDFLWLVLEAIGVPPPVLSAIRELYRHNRHWMRFGGACLEVFTITSGVKQGCPLSPLLFVIAIDPFLRALEKSISPRSLVRGYADDIALVLENLWKEAAATAHLFRTLESISGLGLKPKKCVLIPLWTSWRDGITFRTLLREEVPEWVNFVIDSKGKYLGLWLGPGAVNLSWEKPLSKYVAQCEYIASLKLGLSTTALLYKVFALSALSFVVQICPIPEVAFEHERKVLRLLIPGPGNWIPTSAVHNLDLLFGLPTSFQSLAIWGLAAQCRMALTDLKDCWEHKSSITKALMLDDAPLEHRWGSWYLKSIASTVTAARDQLITMRLCSPTTTLDVRGGGLTEVRGSLQPGPKLQSALCKLLRQKLLPADLYTVLRTRLQRWDGLLAVPLGIAARRAEKVIERTKKEVPPCVLSALARSWLNGWCTARRFQQGRGQCWLSDVCTGDDSIEHYARCEWSWHAAKRKFKTVLAPRHLGRFLLLEPSAQDDEALMALNLYAVYTAVNHFRSSGRRGVGQQAEHRILAAYTQAALLHKKLARRIKSVWINRSQVIADF